MARRVDILTMSPDSLPMVLTVKEAAQVARIGIAQVYAGVRAGKIPVRRFNRTYRIPRDSFLQWLQAQ